MESDQVDLLSECRVTDVANKCPQNSSEEPVCKTTPTTGGPEIYSMW
jgi:hypothetical protein